MATKQMILADGTVVTLSKRRNSRSIRVTLGRDGSVLVTLPNWAPYAAAEQFVKSKSEWIAEHRQPRHVLVSGQMIGKAHRLYLIRTDKKGISTRVKDTEIIVQYPEGLSELDSTVQEAAKKACIRAIRIQADQLLPQRLQTLAETYDFTYSSVTVKSLKGRWGSCDQRQNIVLNIYLMELPWHLIDYVLLHELTHTTVLKHGPDFWEAMQSVLPDVKHKRKEIKQYQPIFHGGIPATNMA